MAKLLKKSLVAMLCVLLCTGTVMAAFPTVKETNKAASAIVTPAPLTEAAASQPTPRELKKAAAKHKYYEGGKRKFLAAIFAIALGIYGVHSFYMGQKGKGFLQLGITLVGLGLYVAGLVTYAASTALDPTVPVITFIGLGIILGMYAWAIVDFVRILKGDLAPEEGFDS